MPKKDGREALREIKADPEPAPHSGHRPHHLEGRGGHLSARTTSARTRSSPSRSLQRARRSDERDRPLLDRDRRAAVGSSSPLIDAREVRFLLVEDDEDDYVLTRDLLADSRRTRFALDWVSSYDEALGRDRRRSTRCLSRRLPPRRARRTGDPARGARRRLRAADHPADRPGRRRQSTSPRCRPAPPTTSSKARSTRRSWSARSATRSSRTARSTRCARARSAMPSPPAARTTACGCGTSATTVYYSDRWKEMLGFTKDEIGDSPEEWFSRVHPDDVEMLRADIDAHRHGATPSIEHEHRMRCGERGVPLDAEPRRGRARCRRRGHARRRLADGHH